MTELRRILAGSRDVGSELVKRGTAMGPLVPLLVLAGGFVVAAWFFRSSAQVHGAPIFSAALIAAALFVAGFYCYQYLWYARHAPDRLQSEEYRIETVRIEIVAARELRRPAPVTTLPMDRSTDSPNERLSRAGGGAAPESRIAEEERES